MTHADCIYLGTILTMEADRPRAEALAVSGGRIAAPGHMPVGPHQGKFAFVKRSERGIIECRQRERQAARFRRG